MEGLSTRAAAVALVIGGTLTAALFVPFTLTHGPTSYNLGVEVLGWDMHTWGFLMGTLPPLLVGGGLWVLRRDFAGPRRLAHRALSVMGVAMFLFAAMNLAFRALGPPVDLFLLAPASVVAAGAVRAGFRPVLVLLATAYSAALVLMLIPLEISDDFGGYRIFGILAYAAVGLVWAGLGTTVLMAERSRTAPLG